MGLNLKELVEMALLDRVYEEAVSLEEVLQAGAPWHELKDRRDICEMMAHSMHHLLKDEEITVRDSRQNGKILAGEEAVMAIRRLSGERGASSGVVVALTDAGKEHYQRLAQRYYNS